MRFFLIRSDTTPRPTASRSRIPFRSLVHTEHTVVSIDPARWLLAVGRDFARAETAPVTSPPNAAVRMVLLFFFVQLYRMAYGTALLRAVRQRGRGSEIRRTRRSRAL